MAGVVGLVLVACATSRPVEQSVKAEPPVTAEQKQAFIELIKIAPTEGEFLSDEGVEQLAPHIRTLFALGSEDVDKEHIYPFAALSSGLCQRESGWRYGVEHFGEIQHPLIKLFWGALLFQHDHSPATRAGRQARSCPPRPHHRPSGPRTARQPAIEARSGLWWTT